ncbi:hypothetical protein BGZ58_000725 [Dissophora ornata]|nr:hypothetical protein BGZ58_000725 [Dissophora ornata]
MHATFVTEHEAFPQLGARGELTTEAHELYNLLEKLMAESWLLEDIPDASLRYPTTGSTLGDKASDLATEAIISQKVDDERAKELQGAQVSEKLRRLRAELAKAITTFQADTYRSQVDEESDDYACYTDTPQNF